MERMDVKRGANVGEGFSPPELPRRKPNRLPFEVYRSGGPFFLTASVRGRRRAFSSSEAVACCLSALRETADKQGLGISEYCFMPDHVHLLVVAPDGADVMAFMQRFKQASGFACNRLLGEKGPFWQRSYYDHVLRREEDLESVRGYINENPVRAGLVEVPEEYPFSGSFVAGREG